MANYEFGPDTRIFGDPDEVSQEEIVENVVEWMEHGAEYYYQEAKNEYGDWLIEELDKDERVTYHTGYKSWARC